MTKPVLHVVSTSGGKDSTATLLLALDRHPRESVRAVFADTGNEHEAVYAYLAYLEERLDIKIDRVREDFSDWMARKRMFIARDRRTRRDKKTGKKMRWTNKQKRRALAALHPTGNPFLDLCMIKGRFPSRRAQFCTQYLKTDPLVRHLHALADEGYEVVSWQGVRRDESRNRRDVLAIEMSDEDMWQYRPIADWTAEEVFAFHKAHDVEPNPLYKLGMSRVGCMPCINVAKMDLREIAKRFPVEVARVREWEKIVGQASKLGGASFLANPDRGADMPNIDAAVQWSMTKHGGRLLDMFADEPPPACSSSYGLCE